METTKQDQSELEELDFKVLDQRKNDGIEVTLLWRAEPPEVKVKVLDTKKGESFSVPVTENENALKVFNHPYSFAGHQAVAASVAR
jgi:hypothetical protein